MTAPTLHLNAAARLGVPVEEIADAHHDEAGFVIRRVDGVSYIDVPADSPDGEGKSGLMFQVAPKDPYSGSFPVYTAHPEPEPEPAKPKAAKTAATPAPEPTGEAGERHALVERAKALGLKVNGRTKTENIPPLIAAKEAELGIEPGSPIGDSGESDAAGGSDAAGDDAGDGDEGDTAGGGE